MAQIVSDNFTRANAANLGANWTLGAGLKDFSIVSNQAATNTVAFTHYDYYSGAGWTGGNDQYAEATVQANPAPNDGGPIVRGATGAQSFYICDINNNDAVALGSSQKVEIYVASAGTFTLVGSTSSSVVSAGDVIRVEAQSTTIRGKINGSQKVSGTDSTFASGKVGMEWWEGPGSSASAISLWAAGDFSGGAAAAFRSIEAHRPAPFAPSSTTLRGF